MLFLFAHLFSFAWAFDISPEYQGLNEQALTRIEAPTDIDSEYQLIWNAYQAPLAWSKSWAQNPREFNYTAGSLSNTYFLIYSQGKFAVDLTDSLSFQFTYFTQRDREMDQTRHVLELQQRLTPFLKIAAYGEPSMFKRENDVGGALLITPLAGFESRFFYTRHDFTRNDHNDLRDRVTKGREPDSMGFSNYWAGQKFWLRSGFRYDQPTEWIRPQEARVFRYTKRLIYGDLEWPVGEKSSLQVRAQWDDTYKEESPDSAASTVALKSWRLKRTWLKSAYTNGREDDPFSYEAALSFVERSWTDQNDQQVKNHNILPSLMTRFRDIRVGVEVNFYNKDDESRLTPKEQLNAPLEVRLNTGYEFSFKNGATLALSLNFDVDDWRVVPAFEGGGGQFRTELSRARGLPLGHDFFKVMLEFRVRFNDFQKI